METIKKYVALLLTAAGMAGCESTTYEDLRDPAAPNGLVTYSGTIKEIVDANCNMCHSPGGISEFRPLTNYTQLKAAVENTNLLDRIQRRSGEEGAMPQTGRMPQDKIDLILQWAQNGLPEN